ncbi:protein GVQW3-like [Octopus bimaculoides]|uniref:protein GVQW3-like n=1 Tax=Octopus bimaculoides TaxID=37653 RepID=UPI00071DD4E1|nr:protein GVQW3-like [Octopus bimaculoides]|eukprot:XP_014788562.1 PREDICTED: putative uncharacterized protein FLJ37770 [Octopus bimaculoides]
MQIIDQVVILESHTPKETFDEIKEVYGDNAPSYDVVMHWHCQFKCGRTSVEIAPIPGQPHSVIDDNTIHKVEASILEDCHITIQQLAQEVKICGKNHSQPFAHAEVVGTMDFLDAHTFSEAGTSQLFPGSFGNVEDFVLYYQFPLQNQDNGSPSEK